MPKQSKIDGTSAKNVLRGDRLVSAIRTHFESADLVRRAICLLNAGQFEQAQGLFEQVQAHGGTSRSLTSFLAACLIGDGKPDRAADQLAGLNDDKPDSVDTANCVRYALALWSAGNCMEAVETLREAIAQNPESAELHFQLGTLLTSLDDYEEAELRFTQAYSIDKEHTEAIVSLALCRGVHNAPGEALAHLQRAQAQCPHDARIGFLLSQAARAVKQQGYSVRVRAEMPADRCTDDADLLELAGMIANDPGFVEAFLCIPENQLDDRVLQILLDALEQVLRNRPAKAQWHHLCGRILDRLGKRQDAIVRNERAVALDPKFTHALIELGRLYQATDRSADATTRFEQAVAQGTEYADVYYMLGNLYRDGGHVEKARSAYRHAITLNDGFEAALSALDSLQTA